MRPPAISPSDGKTVDEHLEVTRLKTVCQLRSLQDPAFWKATKEAAIPPALAERLALWKHCLPDAKSVNPFYYGFEAYSYSVMLLGLGHVPEGPQPAVSGADPRPAEAAFDRLRARTRSLDDRS